MKQKIVINAPMHSAEAKSKAMKIAAAIQGVSSVSIGEENDQLVVIGEGVDSVQLAKSLRKKFCFADIISLEEVKPPIPPAPTPVITPTGTSPPPSPPVKNPVQYCCPPPPLYYECRPVYDDPLPSCSTM